MRYWIEPKDRTYVQGHRCLSFAKKHGQKSKDKYEQKLLDTIKMSATKALKTVSKRAIQKTAEAIDDLFRNKIAEKITKASSKSFREDPRKLTATQIDETSVQAIGHQKKDIYHQKDDNKLLMNFDYYNYKYVARMMYQRIINLLNNNNI